MVKSATANGRGPLETAKFFFEKLLFWMSCVTCVVWLSFLLCCCCVALPFSASLEVIVHAITRDMYNHCLFRLEYVITSYACLYLFTLPIQSPFQQAMKFYILLLLGLLNCMHILVCRENQCIFSYISQAE